MILNIFNTNSNQLILLLINFINIENKINLPVAQDKQNSSSQRR